MLHREKDPTLKTYLQQVGLTTLGFDPGEADNWEGARTRAAYEDFMQSMEPPAGMEVPREGTASVFADLKDLRSFAACKATGKSDRECFKVGDNGVGASGKLTAQDTYPMVALHPIDIRAKHGQMEKAWGKQIRIEYQGKTCLATLEDYMSSPHADIDLNPACVKMLSIPEGGMVPVRWSWADV